MDLSMPMPNDFFSSLEKEDHRSKEDVTIPCETSGLGGTALLQESAQPDQDDDDDAADLSVRFKHTHHRGNDDDEAAPPRLNLKRRRIIGSTDTAEQFACIEKDSGYACPRDILQGIVL